jgi:hypothetical protein
VTDLEIVGGSGETSHDAFPRQREAWMDHGEAVEVVVRELREALDVAESALLDVTRVRRSEAWGVAVDGARAALVVVRAAEGRVEA